MAANPEQGEADLTLGGRVYRMKFGIGALIIAQESLRKDLGYPPAVHEIQQEIRLGRLLYLRALIYAGLQKHQAGTTLDDVDGMLESVTEAEGHALVAAFGFAVTPDPADVNDLGVQPEKNPQQAQTKRRRRSGGGSSSRHVA